MRIALITALLISMATSGVAFAGGDDSAALMATLFQRAKAGDTKGLRALEPKVEETQSSAVQHAYHLARYIAEAPRCTTAWWSSICTTELEAASFVTTESG